MDELSAVSLLSPTDGSGEGGTGDGGDGASRSVTGGTRNFTVGGNAIDAGVGERLVQEELAETLSAIARSGASVFYQGRIAWAIAYRIMV
ncbi:MAG: gamma-glutamyltransferase [Coleofasciculus sp. A1-SPW-01]|uniref:gamma-glutamyltransferase n=1 Tax=Coleofasciculus sp. A1-SPW-01 TaxID=3070819 RepID=UPI0032F2C15D